MPVRDILQIGDPRLRRVSRPLPLDELATPEWQGFIDDLVATMDHANGAGLAAPQVGVPVRLCALHVRADNPRYPYKTPIPLTIAVNPVLEPLGDETFDNYEGCLSVPDLRGLVRRAARLRITYLDRHGVEHTGEVHGLTAGTWQHETDHLDGLLFVDRVTDPTTLCTWANFRAHHEAAFVERVTAMEARLRG